jgi:DNA replication protein
MLPIDYSWRWETAGIPRWCRGRGFDQWQVYSESAETAVRTCAAFAADFPEYFARTSTDQAKVGRGILLVGGTGSGKTTLACMTITEIHWAHDNTILYYPAHLLIEQQRLVDARAADERISKRINRLHTVHVLVIDDLGMEYRTQSGYVGAEITGLLRRRHELGLPTIVTTNLPLAKWDQIYHPTMSSFAKQAFQIVTLTGMDMRDVARRDQQ